MLNFTPLAPTPPERKKPGRKPTPGPKRVKNILVKMTQDEKDAVWAEARKHEMTLSDFVRKCIEEVRDNGFSVPVYK